MPRFFLFFVLPIIAPLVLHGAAPANEKPPSEWTYNEVAEMIEKKGEGGIHPFIINLLMTQNRDEKICALLVQKGYAGAVFTMPAEHNKKVEESVLCQVLMEGSSKKLHIMLSGNEKINFTTLPPFGEDPLMYILDSVEGLHFDQLELLLQYGLEPKMAHVIRMVNKIKTGGENKLNGNLLLLLLQYGGDPGYALKANKDHEEEEGEAKTPLENLILEKEGSFPEVAIMLREWGASLKRFNQDNHPKHFAEADFKNPVKDKMTGLGGENPKWHKAVDAKRKYHPFNKKTKPPFKKLSLSYIIWKPYIIGGICFGLIAVVSSVLGCGWFLYKRKKRRVQKPKRHVKAGLKRHKKKHEIKGSAKTSRR